MQYLFLFPLEINFRDTRLSARSSYEQRIELFSELIEHRYRKQGYDINWLLFGMQANPSHPDIHCTAPLIQPHDRILSCNLSFEKHTAEEKYPDPNYTLDQLAAKPLVIGGFHNHDCVEKMAACAHSRGIHTFVDDDTTEIGIARLNLGNRPPQIRQDPTLRELHLGISEHQLQWIYQDRLSKPWRVQKLGPY